MDLLTRAGMTGAKPVSSPATSNVKLSRALGDPLTNPTEYRNIVGGLQYLTLTRRVITFAVNLVCQYMHAPTTSHLVVVKRVLRFLKGTITFGLHFRPGPLCLIAYCDTDWAGNLDDRRSTSGYCVYFGPNPISWSAKKQAIVARSSTEAEYSWLAHIATEISWFRILLRNLHIFLHHMPLIWCDNISAISLASSPILHAHTKHVEVDYHYICEKVVRNDLAVRFVQSKD
ncbi:hypothetical protein AAC387_Pa12g0857 [Persea americana]